MFIILSQRKDIESSYSDSIYKLYHFPSRYKNKIHEGDDFIYYQGDQRNREHRIYFGMGKIGKIRTSDGTSYYAELVECKSFEKEISIYLEGDTKYIESLGYETIRNGSNPPWQWSIRPISEKAYQYIVSHAGKLTAVITDKQDFDNELKQAIKKYYLGNDVESLKKAYDIIGLILGKTSVSIGSNELLQNDEVRQLIDYCKSMRMQYSYKALLMLTLVDTPNFSINVSEAVSCFREYYTKRKNAGQKLEKSNCIYQSSLLSDSEIASNILQNPIRALLKSGYFDYDTVQNDFSIKKSIAEKITEANRTELREVCKQKLKAYYHSLGDYQ